MIVPRSCGLPTLAMRAMEPSSTGPGGDLNDGSPSEAETPEPGSARQADRIGGATG